VGGAFTYAVFSRRPSRSSRRACGLAALGERRSGPAALVRRAKLLLLAAEGVANTEIAERLGISRPTVMPGAAGMRARG
jgi:DNA-binding NarL/FixJ family response regulator